MKTAIFNDTSPDWHYGCDAVMSTLTHLMASNDINIEFLWPVSKDWTRFIDKIEDFDFELIVVNGEGSIHHPATRRKARALLELGEYSRKTGKKSFLINTTLFSLSDADFELLRYFDGIYARERSTQQLLLDQDIKANFCPDLSMFATVPFFSGIRQGTLYTDSVLPAVTQRLKETAAIKNAYFLPLQPQAGRLRNLAALGLRKTRRVFGYQPLPARKSKFKPNTKYQELFLKIRQSEFVVTGRFHAATICLATMTPFIALESNTPKIEYLLRDALGNSERCFKNFDDLIRAEKENASGFQSFSEEEMKKLKEYLKDMPKHIDNMLRHMKCEI